MLKNKRQVLITLMIGTSMAAIDSSIVNVSLPVMRSELNVTMNQIEWVTTAYMIAFCLFIPLTNWLKSRIGYYTLFLGSIIIFTFGSLLCSLSQSLPMLVVARVIQAIGGGSLTPTSLAILSENYPKEERGSAIGWWGIGNVMGPALGPTLGGLLTYYLGWESIFYVNVPIGLFAIYFTVRYLSFLKKQPITKPKFDIGSFVWFTFLIVAIQYTISVIDEKGPLSWFFLTGLSVSTTAFFFFLRSSRKKEPLLDLSVFKSATFNKAAVITLLRSLGLFGGLFFLPFMLQGQLGYSEIQSGLLMLPNALMMLITRPFAGKMADKGLIRNISAAGIIMVILSFLLFARIDVGTSIWMIILPMVIRGLGMSLLVAPVSTALLNSVRTDQTQTATAMNSLFLQLGGSIGIAVSGVFHAWIYDYYIGKGKTEPVAEHIALQDSFLITAFIIALALIPALKLPKKAEVQQEKRIPEVA